ncbi:hypothetical protein AWW66_21450 [Micromonospora rosaria]|uniref:Uncharacterized protein n=1 Tax=Micromonospora rosaria TaxID=47874 RepID=A0A136PND3_9ACTN|nr:hypothetical protein [Micromonospora rosaria]KXK59939.1 hypothetical protein AWW66_21450 [Micromonospora rosaria]
MTSPAESAPSGATQASQVTKPLRELGALVFLGANAVLLFVGLIRLLAPVNYGDLTNRAGQTYFTFVGLESSVLPVLAVLLATHIQPVVPKAKLITQVALAEYAFGAVLGALTFLIWSVGRLAAGAVLDVLLGVLTRVAWLALFAVGAFVVYQVWRALYHVPKPKPQPGVYGQPQPGWPQQAGGYGAPGQQPGGYPAAGQPGGYPPAGQYGYPGPNPSPASAPPFGTPPQSAPPFGTVSSAPQPASPFGGPPPSGSPLPAQPTGSDTPSTPPSGQWPPAPVPSAPPAPPFGQPPSADPTQAIPRQSTDPTGAAAPRPADATEALPRRDGDDDRTQPFTSRPDPE